MVLAQRLLAEARQARLIARNVAEERYHAMLIGLAERLEREARLLETDATPGPDGSAPASTPDGHR